MTRGFDTCGSLWVLMDSSLTLKDFSPTCNFDAWWLLREPSSNFDKVLLEQCHILDHSKIAPEMSAALVRRHVGVVPPSTLANTVDCTSVEQWVQQTLWLC